MAHKHTVGETSSGTLLTADLVSAFSWELHYSDVAHTAQEKQLLDDCNVWMTQEDEDQEEDKGQELLEDLTEALESRAPAYCYFGANEGDGACFGYWPCMGQIDELPNVEDSDEAIALGEDCKHVNDHGNVTVYGGDGKVIFDLV